jgi:hypothetical protein
MVPRAIPYHTFLVAAVPVLAIFVVNVGQVATADILPSLGMSLLLAAILLAAGRLVTGDLRRGGLVASLALLLLFSHGHIQAVLLNARVGSPTLWQNRHLLPIWALIIVLVGIALARTRRRFETLTGILTITTAFVVALQVGQIALFKARAALSYRTISSRRMSAFALPAGAPRAHRPDIYYIIMDRYPNERCLREFFGFDNQPFRDFLRSRGFYVASKSHSNYTDTAHSLASSLNMEYITYLGAPARLLPADWMPLFRLIKDNRLAQSLTGLGYRFIHFGTCWPPTVRNPHAFRNVNFIRLEEFDRLLWEHSGAWPVLRTLGLSDPFREKQVRIERNFTELAKLPQDPQPTFAFAHFLLPHPPFVFGDSGPYAQPPGRNSRSDAELFIAQLRYANLRLTELVDALLSQSPDPPIIVLQGDEGPYPEGLVGPASFSAMGDEDLRDKTSILNALFLPGVSPERLYPTVSPVNTFRFVLHEYFAADLGFLPDSIYAFPDFSHLYEFSDVTVRAREPGSNQGSPVESVE